MSYHFEASPAEAISALITRMLAKQPVNRFDDAGALGTALDDARQGRRVGHVRIDQCGPVRHGL